MDESDTMARILSQQVASLIVTSQPNPRQKSHYPSRSPTESMESRLRWARYESWLLRAVHHLRSPTFLMTIQWNTTVEPGQLKEFDRNIGRSLREHSDRSGYELRFYSVKEIDARQLVHSHVLVRTDLELKELQTLFDDRCQRISGSQATVTYCEPIGEAAAVACYVTKGLRSVRAGEKELRLFHPGLVRLRSQMRYFAPWPLPDLRNEGRELWLHEVRRFKLSKQAVTFDGITRTLFDHSAMLTTNVSDISIPSSAEVDLFG